jgi:hypothetical protein
VLAGGAAGAVAGGLLGATAGLVAEPHRGIVVGLLCAAVAVGSVVRPKPLWERDQETDQGLLRQGPLRWAARNGALLGLGFTSRLGFWTWYLIPLGITLTGEWRLGAVAWGGYGITRLGVAVVAAYASTGPERLLTQSTTLLGLRRRATGLTRIVAAVTAATLSVVALF